MSLNRSLSVTGAPQDPIVEDAVMSEHVPTGTVTVHRETVEVTCPVAGPPMNPISLGASGAPLSNFGPVPAGSHGLGRSAMIPAYQTSVPVAPPIPIETPQKRELRNTVDSLRTELQQTQMMADHALIQQREEFKNVRNQYVEQYESRANEYMAMTQDQTQAQVAQAESRVMGAAQTEINQQQQLLQKVTDRLEVTRIQMQAENRVIAEKATHELQHQKTNV